MLHTADKYTLPIFQSSITAAGTATGNIDRLGFDYVNISVLLPTADVVSNKPTVLKISESDDTVVTNFADVTAFVGGGTGGFTIPNAITAATSITGPFAVLNVNCTGRKRFLKVSVSPATTQVVNVLARLTRAEQMKTTAAAQNATVLVEG